MGQVEIWTNKSLRLQEEDPAFKVKLLKLLGKYYENRTDLKIKAIPQDVIDLFCKEFPEEKIVKDYLEEKRGSRALLTTAIRNMVKALPIPDLLDAAGMTDTFLFNKLKENIEGDNRKVSNDALTLAFKLKRYLVDGRSNANAIPRNTQINMKEPTFYISGAKNKKEAMKDLLESYDKLKELSEHIDEE